MNFFNRLWYFIRREAWFHIARIRKIPNTARNWSAFWADYQQYVSGASGDEEIVLQPLIDDRTSQTPIEPIYYYQDAWAFERIYANQPAKHIDVGSNNKFVSLLSKVVPTTMVDIRPLSLRLESLDFVEGSILELPFEDESCESISSICVVEHIGLGRYGDPIDHEGTVKALKELVRVLAPGGRLCISVPIDDTNKTFFNGQRAFTEETILKMCEPLVLVDKAYIFGREFLASPKTGYGTGCYEFEKPS